MCTGALDIAAHLKLLGESLSIIGARLQEHHVSYSQSMSKFVNIDTSESGSLIRQIMQ